MSGKRLPLVSRHAQIAELRQAMLLARQGHGSTVFLVAEAGLGRSRLIREAAELATVAGMRVVRGRTSRTGPAAALRPVAEALLHLRRDLGESADSELDQAWRFIGRLTTDPPSSQTSSLMLLAEEMLRLAALAGRGRGCVIILEDLHDADPTTLAVVEFLADHLGHHGTTLLATMRAEPCPAWDLACAVAHRGGGTVLRLGPLRPADTRDLVAAYLEVVPQKVPQAVLDRLDVDAAGNPFLVVELLAGILQTGALVQEPDGWRFAPDLATDVPPTVVRWMTERAERVGPCGAGLLQSAAVIGRRCPLSVLHTAVGVAEPVLLEHLQAAVAAKIVVADEPAPHWYAFASPLTVRALRSALTPAGRARLAQHAADVLDRLHPGLPGEWCRLAAELRSTAGDRDVAVRLLIASGRRDLAAGQVGAALEVLERAWRWTGGGASRELRAEALEALLDALTETGDVLAARCLAGALDELCTAGLPATRVAALRTRLAWLAVVGGRWDDASAQVAEARASLGAHGAGHHRASLNAVAAHVLAYGPGADLGHAEQLARRTLDTAERLDVPEAAWRSWHLLGLLAQRRGCLDAAGFLERAYAVALDHRQVVWAARSAAQLANAAALRDGDGSPVQRAAGRAARLGAAAAEQDALADAALHHVLAGRYAAATELLDRCEPAALRLGRPGLGRQAALVRATLAAHQGDRQSMQRALEAFGAAGGDRSPLAPLAGGLARAVCALLEEDRARAGVELAGAAAQDAAVAAHLPLAGRHGLGLLLAVLSGDAGWAEYEQAEAAPAAELGWNRQFRLFARAVLTGRAGRRAEAVAAVAVAERAAEPYPMARHLGLRLVAEAACADRWSDPADWLRRAEDYFHTGEVSAVAGACRGLLRRIGRPAPQRRRGVERVPPGLRRLGVTAREYEVLRSLTDAPDNRTLAARLFISPRTVEKHVASLLTKTQQPNRVALRAYAARVDGPDR